MTDPLIARMATDSADAAQFVAAMAAGDTWEWQTILDDITDVERAKRMLAAMAGLYVGRATAVCARTGQDPVDWLHRCALEQIEIARSMQ
jgi:hypothetical protein